MSNFNLNDPGDFARLTAGSINNILSSFQEGKDITKWDIQESSYLSDAGASAGRLPIVFHVFKTSEPYNAAVAQVSDTMGRRKAKYLFPYVNGQTTDDLGSKPQTFDFDVLIFGNNYLTALNNLLVEINDPTPGTLIHPVLGKKRCVCEDFSLTHTNEKRKAVALKLVFVEHSFTIQNPTNIQSFTSASTTSALSKLMGAFADFQSLANTVQANINAIRTLKNKITQAISDFQSRFASTATNINATFNPSSPSIPGLLPINNGGILNPGGTIGTGVVPSVVSPSDPFASIPLSSLSPAVSLTLASNDLAKQIQTLRDSGAAIIQSLIAIKDGGLYFHADIVNLKQALVNIQDAFEKGVASSKARLVQYTTPWDMSIREVAFANGIPIDSASDIQFLNPQLQSVNLIPKGTSITVAVTS